MPRNSKINFLESIINKTIKYYRQNHTAIFHKKNLDVKFSHVDYLSSSKKELRNSWISRKSTVDYYGVFKGIFIAFEAKSTKSKSLPLKNIKEHQIKYLEEIVSWVV